MRYIKNTLLIGHHSNIVKDTYVKFVDKIFFLNVLCGVKLHLSLFFYMYVV